MTKTEKAVTWAIRIANDPAHGYDQDNRWGPDYDCSSLVISAWQQAGVPVKTKGATYTGNMKSVFLSCGFKDVTSKVNLSTGSGMKRGDVLLNIASHTVMHIGNGQVVSASKMKIMDIMVVNPEIRAEKRSNFRVITISPGIAFSVILKILQLLILILNLSQLQEMQNPQRSGYANKFANAGISITERDAATKKQALKFFRQL